MNDLWREFSKRERQITAPPYLESRVLAALRRPRETSRTGTPRALLTALTTCAAIVLAILWPSTHQTTAPQPLSARPLLIASLPQAVTAERPVLNRMSQTPSRIRPDVMARYDDLTRVLVTFDAAPLRSTEPVQIVRLRVRRDALQALGLAVLEPNAEGTIDLDMVVGQDGLPRDIRTIRNQQEER